MSMPSASASFLPLGAFRPAGDLQIRLQRNFDRLEEEKYRPENVFQREKEAGNWPGDTEGRTVLALVLLAQATGREPRYLDEILSRWSREVNTRGYFGHILSVDTISEQQLAGHGWVLRALAELERWRPGGPARSLAAPILENLILPTAGQHRLYPLDPAVRRTEGQFSGTHLGRVGRWLLSTDVGCDFICLDGVVDAFDVFRDERLRPVIEEMSARFLELDLAAVKAQTHATLTACRALLRWSAISGDDSLVPAVAERYALYTQQAWTEHYANFNWFGRPEWTEPCAIVDSLMVAMELWRRTQAPGYLEDVQHIYFNALAHAQRSNGGFGCDNCPGADGEDDLFFKVYEAHWCCTMRGGEGLSRVAQYCLAATGDEWRLPLGLAGDVDLGGAKLTIASSYPTEFSLTIRASGFAGKDVRTLALFVPSWVKGIRCENTAGVPCERVDGWLRLPVGRDDESWTISGDLVSSLRPVLNPLAARKPRVVRQRGALLLAESPGESSAEPIFHAMKSGIVDPTLSRRRLLIETPDA
jgi:hypothetical protein